MADRDDFNRQRGEQLRGMAEAAQVAQVAVGPAQPQHEYLDVDELVAQLGTQLGPFDRPPSVYLPHHVKIDLLRRTFAGVELAGWDNAVLGWLANADGDTVLALAGMVHRAMADATERAWADSADHGG